jgi:hypothetical protein
MKNQHLFKSLIFLLALIALPLAQAVATDGAVKRKTIERTFSVNKDVEIEVDNRYGLVHVNTWTQNKVELKVEIMVERRSESRAQDLLDRIEIQIDEEGKSFLSFETDIDGNVNLSGSEKLEINYTLNVPISSNLELENRYGDIYLADFEGPLNIDLAYGHLKMERIRSQQAQLDLAYGNGEIKEMQHGFLETSYANMAIGILGSVDVDNAYGNLTIEKAGKLKIDSRYGNLKIVEVLDLEGEVAYANMEIDKIAGKLILEARYMGSVDIEEILNSVQLIDIDGRYSGIYLRYASDLKAELEFEVEHANLRYDDKNIDFSFIHESNFKNTYKGTLNNGGKTKIKVTSGYGDVRFRPVRTYPN